MSNWYTDYENIKNLAYWLLSKGKFNSEKDVVYFIEKPWKWEEEWNEMMQEEENLEILKILPKMEIVN